MKTLTPLMFQLIEALHMAGGKARFDAVYNPATGQAFTPGTWAAVIDRKLVTTTGKRGVWKLTPLALDVLGRGKDSKALIQAADEALAAQRAVASNPDNEVSWYGSPQYLKTKKALLEAIKAAFPGIDAMSVWHVSIDSGEGIAYCARHVQINGKFRI